MAYRGHCRLCEAAQVSPPIERVLQSLKVAALSLRCGSQLHSDTTSSEVSYQGIPSINQSMLCTVTGFPPLLFDRPKDFRLSGYCHWQRAPRM